MIPLFPKFKKLELKDKAIIEEFTSKHPAYSDFNFVSLWGYNTEEDTAISSLHDNLVIKLSDYITNEKFYSFLGTNKVDSTIKILLSNAKKDNILPYLKLIPEKNVSSEINLHQEFHIQEDRDNFDYVLSISEYISLQTSKYYNHRKLISKFTRNNPEYSINILDLTNKKIQQEVINFFYLWEKKKGRNRKETQHELTALKRTLKDSSYLNLFSLGLYVKDKLLGIIISDLNHKEHIESHFLKYNPDFNGINHILHHFLAKKIGDKKHKYLNIEQDLGISGIRMAKEATKPIHFLKKYIISDKNSPYQPQTK